MFSLRQEDEALMLKITSKKLKKLTKPYYTRFWGQKRLARAVFIETALGDGNKLIALSPLSSRPNYYLIRVDSSWSIDNDDPICICDHIDEIYDAVDAELGPMEWTDDRGRNRIEKWPALDYSYGSSWWEVEL
jgi:hypothetical protein